LTNLQVIHAGDYTAVITNTLGSVTSSPATLTITTIPVITHPPQSLAVSVGANATFTVTATGALPLSYQWRFNSENLSGATNASYTRTNASLAVAGNYTVVVTNSSGSVTSSVAVLTVNPPASGATNLTISQIYGGGGNTGATYRYDFVELFNPTPNAINVTGWSLQYASSTGTSWQIGALNGSIPAYHYYLIQLASGSVATGDFLPLANATNGFNISASQGKLALVSSTAGLTGSNPSDNATVVDFVGYGSANAFEGAAAAPGAPTGNNTTSIIRNDGGLTDSGNNADDFTTLTPPAPRNAASPANPPLAPPTPASTPILTNAAFLDGKFQFTLMGTATSNYLVLATTNLGTDNWSPVHTNAAPFVFVETNAANWPQRFYRALIAP
jgi:hypothetical protein